MKVFLQSRLGLLLLISLFGKAQQVTANNNVSCNDHQYKPDSLEKCCSRCAPGTYMKRECTKTTDTECQPCADGKYTQNWNYVTQCNSCKMCPPFLVEKENCSSTRKRQCVCPEGSECKQTNGVGDCIHCVSIPSPTDQPWVIPIIIATVLTVSLTVFILTILVTRRNTTILEMFGCIAKIKKPQPESTGGQASTTQALLPTENNLPYPIEETSATQSAEYALNSTRQNPV